MVYRILAWFLRVVSRVFFRQIEVIGLDHIPATGGAVMAINHTSYIDFLPAALAAHYRKRRIRFMIKLEMAQIKVVGYLIKHTKTISVDRSAGAGAYAAAVQALRGGELVGVYPEATISRSFEIKEFKSGSARMAIAARVPIVPHIVWGAQRIWTKGQPKNLYRPKVPISIADGEPIEPTLPVTELSALLHSRMQHLLEQVQDAYGPHPPGAFWVPHRLDSGAPSLAEANRMDLEDAAEKAARRAQRGPAGAPG